MAQSPVTKSPPEGGEEEGDMEEPQTEEDDPVVPHTAPLTTKDATSSSPKRQQRGLLQKRSAPSLTVHMVSGGRGKKGQVPVDDDAAEEEVSHMQVLSLSPGAESTPDSCYDSDGSGSGSQRSSGTRSELHTDVSRTVSDTLAAEHTEVVTMTTNLTSGETPLMPEEAPAPSEESEEVATKAPKRSCSDDGSRDTLVKQETQEFSLSSSGIDGPMIPDPEEDPPLRPNSQPSNGGALEMDTTAQVVEGLQEMMLDISNTEEDEEAEDGPDVVMEDEEELDDDDDVDDELKAVRYGIRLGYSQELTQHVIDELGPDARKDDLLQELIRHTEVQKDDDGEEEEEGPIACSWVPPVSTETLPKDDREVAKEEKTEKEQQLATQITGDVQAAGGKDIANLRPIIIDGSNIAMSHGNKQVFSCRGIRLAVDYFRDRGHSKVTVFVPSWRKEASRQDTQIVDQELLYELEQEKTLVFTPSRWVSGKRIVCYDDLYIIKLAAEDDGIVVSNDNYRDLINKSPEYKRVIEERLLMYSFVNDRFMPPDDPLGRHGPSLDNFLSKHPVVPEPLPPACPYGKKCTYGNKCKYYHPERGTTPRKSVLEVLQEKERVEIAKVRPITKSREPSPADMVSRDKSPTPSEPGKKAPPKTRSFVSSPKSGLLTKKALARTRSLATGAVGGARGGTGTLPSPPVPYEPLSMQAKAMADQQTTDRLTDDMQSSGNDTESTTPGAATKSYFSKGSQDDEVVDPEPKHELFSRMADKFSASSSCCQSLESLQLPASWSKGPANETLRQLKPLRTTFSDPQGDPYFDLDCGHLSLAKKLSDEGNEEEQEIWQNALLSAVASSGTPMAVVSPHTSPGRQHPKAGQQPEEPKQNAKNSNGHRRLQRQLSLQGSEDPRLLPKGSGRGLNSGQGSPGGQKMKKDQKRHMSNTKFTFHSASGLAGPFPSNYSQENKVQMGSLSAAYTFSDQSEQQQHQHQQQHLQQQQQQQQYGVMGQVYDITDHSVVGRHASFSGGETMQSDHHHLLRQQQSLRMPRGGEQQQQQSLRMSPGERIAACRMASAPGTYSYHKSSVNNSALGPYWHSSSIMPTIHRQNSTSDPQLHTLQDSSSGRGDGSDARMLGIYNHQQMLRRGLGAQESAGNSTMMWTQSFEVPTGNRGGMKSIGHLFDDHLNLPGSSMDDRIPRCGSFDSSLPSNRVNSGSSSFDGAIHLSGSYEELPSTAKSHSFEGTMSSSEIGQYSSGLDGGLEMSAMHSYYQQQQQQQHEASTGTRSPDHTRHYGTDNKPYGSDQSLFMASRMHMNSPVDNYHHMTQGSSLMAPRKSSPDIYSFLSQVQQPLPSQPSPPVQQQHPSTQQHQQQQHQQQHQQAGLQQQDLFTGQISHRLVNRISPVMMACGEGLLSNTAPSPPHPDDQTPCSVPDTRRKLFYHLCGLFPEAEVREAMQRLPMETQPEKLLSYILGMRSLHTN